MQLSQTNAKVLLLDTHLQIEEHAEWPIRKIFGERDFHFLTYPPNCGFTELEVEQLKMLDSNEQLKSALRKILANSSAGIVFDLLNLVDGTTDPINQSDEWTGVKLIDEDQDEDAEPVGGFMHDLFFETYWDWKKIRGEKGWSLDTLNQ